MLDLIETTERDDERVEAMRVSEIRDEAVTRRNVGRFERAMVIAVIILLLLNSGALVNVVNAFGVGPVQDTVVAMGTTWDEQMEKTGLKKFGNTIRDGVANLRAKGWEAVSLLPDSDSAQKSVERGALLLRGMLEDVSKGTGLMHKNPAIKEARG